MERSGKGALFSLRMMLMNFFSAGIVDNFSQKKFGSFGKRATFAAAFEKSIGKFIEKTEGSTSKKYREQERER